MKTKKMFAVILSAVIAASAAAAPVYAEDEPTMMTMDNPFSGTVEKQEDGAWLITDRGMKLLNADYGDDAGMSLHFTLTEKVDETLTAVFTFSQGENKYELPYIMMKPVYTNEEGANLYILFKDVSESFNEKFSDKGLKAEDMESITVDIPGADVTDLEITAKRGVYAPFEKGVYAAYAAGEDDSYSTLSTYFIFDDEANGRTADPETGAGTSFTCEQNNESITFHMGSADDVTKAEIIDTVGSKMFYMQVDYGEDAGIVTYELYKLDDCDPGNFDAADFDPLANGVWAAYGKDDFGSYDKAGDYYIFDDDKSGHTSDRILGIGLPFTYEIKGMDAVFHFADADDNTPAVLHPTSDGDYMIEFDYGDNKSTFRLTKDRGSDPKTFEVEPVALIGTGVYAAYKESNSGELDELTDFFVFGDDENGCTISDIDMGIGLPFTYEQNENGLLFHFGSADDNTFASVKFGSSDSEYIVTVSYDEGEVTYLFVPVEGADPETFTFSEVTFANIGYDVSDESGSKLCVWNFTDEKNGVITDAATGQDTPFTYEIGRDFILMHCGTPTDNSYYSLKADGKGGYIACSSTGDEYILTDVSVTSDVADSNDVSGVIDANTGDNPATGTGDIAAMAGLSAASLLAAALVSKKRRK